MTKPSLQEVIRPETQHNTHFHHLKNPFNLEIQPRSRFIFPLLKVSSLRTKPQYLCVSVCLFNRVIIQVLLFLKQLLKNISLNRVCKVKAVLIACY